MNRVIVRRTWHAWVAAGCLAAAVSCSKTGTGTAAKPAAVGKDVWAVVNGAEIRRDDVEKAYRGSIDPTAAPAPDAEALGAKLTILDQLITQELLLSRAKGLGAEPTDTEVDAAVTERRAGMPDDVFQQELTKRGMSADDFRKGVRRELTVQKVLDKDVTSKVVITDQAIGDFYAQNRAQFNLAEPQFRLAQIVITPVRDPQLRNRKGDDAATPDEAHRKADMVNAQLQKGVDFAEVAMDYSEDPQSVQRGGDLGFLPASALNRVAPAVRDAVLKMQPGNVSTLSQNGAYTILMLVAKEPAGQRTLDTPGVKDNIKNGLQTRQQELVRNAYLAAARNGAQVTNYLAQQILDAQIGSAPAAPLASPKK